MQRAGLLLLMALMASPAWADVAALSYTDPGGQEKLVAPSQQYINPAGAVSLYLTAGLDRKVGYVITDAAGQAVAEGVSDLITPSDTLTVQGKTYYGKVLSVPAALAEGNYTLAAQILDGAGNVVATQSYPLVVDRTPPAAGEWWRLVSYNTRALGDNEVVTGTFVYQIWLKDVSDLSGVASVQFESYDLTAGQVYASKAGWYNADTREAGIGSSYSIELVGNKYLPAQDGPLGLRFILADRAGNQAVYAKRIKFDGTRDPLPELVAVRNPNITTEFIPGSGLVGYEPYRAGMTVYENPVKLLYRLPRSNWRSANPDYGVYIWYQPNINQSVREPSVIYQDDVYVYFDVTVPYSPADYRIWHLTGSSSYNIGIPPKLQLAASATQSPNWLGFSYYRTDTGWTAESANGSVIFLNDPGVAVSQMKIRVEPRPYDQVFSCGIAQCTIPAGQTECIADVRNPNPVAGGWVAHSVNHSLKSADGALYRWGGWTAVVMDLQPPQITSYQIDRINKQVTYTVYSYPDGWNGQNLLPGYWLLAHDVATGQQVKLNGVKTVADGYNRQITVNYSSLPDGVWQFTAQAQDNAGNLGSLAIGQVVLDRTPPAVEFYREAAVLPDHGQTDSLGKVRFKVTDNVDAAPRVESVRFTGGPENLDVFLAYHQQGGEYILEYPVLYPSAGREYTLTVTAVDANGNRRTQTLAFSYEPPSVQLTSNGQAVLNLPAIPAPVVHADGSNGLVSQPVTVNGSPLSGSYDLTVIAAADSTTGVVVGGTYLAPGEMTQIAGYSFGVNQGRLNLPVWSAQEGQAKLVITSLAPDFPVLRADLRFWRPQVELAAAPGWAVQPLIEEQQIGAQAVSGTPCQVTLDEAEAREADPIDNPKCLVEFTRKPKTYQVQGNKLLGTLGPDESLELGYQVALFSGGTKYIMGAGSRSLGRKPLTAVSVGVSASPGRQVYRQVQFLQLTANSDGAVPCRVTDNELEARRWGAVGPACLVRWTSKPEGLAPARLKNLPALQGYLGEGGPVAWTVDLYAPAGQMSGVSSRSLSLATVEPPAPEFTIQPAMYSQQIAEQVFATSDLAGGQFGQAVMGSRLSDVRLTMELSGLATGVVSRQYTVGGGSVSRVLAAGPLQVWEKRRLRARAYYTDLPGLETVREATVVGVPSAQLQMRLLSASQGLTSSGVGVRVEFGLPGKAGLAYDAARDGVWRVQLGRLDNRNQWQPVTAWQELPASGIWETAVPVNDPAYVKLQALAELVPPADLLGYSRRLLSNRVYALVLKGEAPAGQLIGRKISGPAPLTALLSLRAGTTDRQVLGGIAWQLSRDNGATWEEIAGAKGMQAVVTVNAGTYLVRAQLANRLSGAIGYTETVQLAAYDLPRLVVEGPRAVLAGEPVVLAARYYVGDSELPSSAVAVEWLDQDGQVLGSGPTFRATPAETGLMVYQVRARPASPEADGEELQQAVRVRVAPPLPPSVAITGPANFLYSAGNTPAYHFEAAVTPPLGLEAGTVEGEWELPDGRRVPGLTLAYTPTEEDAANQRVLLRFSAWMAGYKEQTTKTVARAVNVREYAWPDFSLEVKGRYAMAPSLVTLTAMPSTRQPWKLEEPVYIWRLPSGFQVRNRYDRGRVLEVYCPEAGSFDVAVEVQDARGSVATAAAMVELSEPPPLQVGFAPIFSNPDYREPLNLILRPRVTGGHPQDRLAQYSFEVDDPQAVVVVSGGAGLVTGLTAGERTVRLTGVSQFNKPVEGNFAVTVQPNQPPSCTVTTETAGRTAYATAACHDPDGRVVAYRWYRDGRVVSSISKVQVGPDTAALEFEAVDNGGAIYRQTVYFQRKEGE